VVLGPILGAAVIHIIEVGIDAVVPAVVIVVAITVSP